MPVVNQAQKAIAFVPTANTVTLVCPTAVPKESKSVRFVPTQRRILAPQVKPKLINTTASAPPLPQTTNARRINGVTTTAVIRPRRIRGKGGRIHRTRQLVGTAKDATMRPAGVLEKAKRHARWQLPRWDGRSTGRGKKTTGMLRKDVTKRVTRPHIITTSTPLERPVVQSISAYALISPGPPSALGPTQLVSRPAAASVGPRNPVKLVSIVMICRTYAPLYQNQIPTKALHHRQIPTKALHHRQIPTKVRVQVRVVTESPPAAAPSPAAAVVGAVSGEGAALGGAALVVLVLPLEVALALELALSDITIATTKTHRNRMVAVPTTTTSVQTVVAKDPVVR